MSASHHFIDLLRALETTATGADDVVGLVAFGSTADLARTDEWSDHDFAWITTDTEAADRYRNDLVWLPNAGRIALSVVEYHGGVKVVYEDGHRLEFGITDLAGFATWAGSPARVIVGDTNVHAALQEVTARRPEGDIDPHREVRLFITQLLTGVARAHRGETLSGSAVVNFEAVNHLMRAITTVLSSNEIHLDVLDPRRRFELVHPELGVRITAASRRPVVDAARQLLEIAEEGLGRWAQFPHSEFALASRLLPTPPPAP